MVKKWPITWKMEDQQQGKSFTVWKYIMPVLRIYCTFIYCTKYSLPVCPLCIIISKLRSSIADNFICKSKPGIICITVPCRHWDCERSQNQNYTFLQMQGPDLLLVQIGHNKVSGFNGAVQLHQLKSWANAYRFLRPRRDALKNRWTTAWHPSNFTK